MPFQELNAAEYPLDFKHPPHSLWHDVIRAESDAARALGEAGWRSLARESARHTPLGEAQAARLARMAAHPFAWLYRCTGGRHLPEVEAWARGLQWPVQRLLMLQCLYELSHLGAPARRLGCSSGIVQLADGRPAHVRCLDWNLPEIAGATRLFHCRTRRGHEAKIVGLVGQVGALSAMVPGGYSVTLNWAPPASLPVFLLGPLFALRELVDTCAHFHEAVNFLKARRFASSVFFTVCGVQSGEGCVVECVKPGLFSDQLRQVRTLEAEPLVQTNHYHHPEHERFNPTRDPSRLSMLEATSRARAATLLDALRALPARPSLDQLGACLARPPVENDETCQKMVFIPATGEMRVWVGRR